VSWEQELRAAYRTPNDLVQAGLLSPEEVIQAGKVSLKYQFLLPQYYANLIDKKDPHCPIRLQAIPSFEELESRIEEMKDPLQDLQHQPIQRITHRYQNRALFHLTPNCSMYCRFCFRKTLLNELKPSLFSGTWKEAFQYLRQTPEVSEVIFSGGDPLMVGDEVLRKVLEELEAIAHLKRVRFHTRVPVTFPSRVTLELSESLSSTRFHPVVVTHFNHPKEVTLETRRGLELLKKRTVLLNQSVLLRRVNDSIDTLVELSEKLFEAGVLPYYLHQLDPSIGTGHFFVAEGEGQRIWEGMKSRLPGYLVPRYVKDIVGIPYKSSV